MRTELGKIESVFFGRGGYQDVMIGIHFTLSGKGWGVSTSKDAWDPAHVEHSPRCKWSEADRSKSFDEIVREISTLLHKANVDRIDDLKGVPIEATFDGNTLHSWRILTEVL